MVLNLYPFEATVAKGSGFDTCIKNIDIGGPSMLRRCGGEVCIEYRTVAAAVGVEHGVDGHLRSPTHSKAPGTERVVFFFLPYYDRGSLMCNVEDATTRTPQPFP